MAVNAERVVILSTLRTGKDFPTEDALRKYLKEHPDADPRRHKVDKGPKPGQKPPQAPKPEKTPADKGVPGKPSKPPPVPKDRKKPPVPKPEAKGQQPGKPEAKKPPGGGKAPDKPEAKGQAPEQPQSRLEAWKGRFKGLSEKAQKFVSEAPKSVKHFLGDTEFRKQTLKEARKAVTSAPKKFTKNLIETVKHEKREFRLAVKGVGKVISGKKMSKHEREAFRAIATHMAIAGGAAAAMASGPLGGAGLFAKGIATHIAAKSASKSLENLHLLQELGHVGHGVVHLLSHIASEDKEAPLSPEEAMARLVLASVLKEMESLTDEDFAQILNNLPEEKTARDRVLARFVS